MKEKIKKGLNIINFKIFTIITVILLLIGILITGVHTGYCGTLFILISMIFMLVEFILFFIKQMIDDLKLIVIVLIGIVWFIAVTTLYGEFINYIVPKKFNTNADKMYELYFSTFSAIMSAMIAVGGTYFGAVYGGKKAIEVTEKQLNVQEEKEREKLMNNKQIAIRIITKLLKEEIKDNEQVIKEAGIFSKVKKGYGVQCSYAGLEKKVSIENYDNIKYEIIKYCEEEIVEDVIDIYEMFYILLRHRDLNEISKKEFAKIVLLEGNLNKLLSKINN